MLRIESPHELLEVHLIVALYLLLFAFIAGYFKIKRALRGLSLYDLFDLFSTRRYRRNQTFHFMPLLQEKIERHISLLENEYRLRLSPEAKTMLIVPLLEYYQFDNNEDADRQPEWRDSLTLIIRTISEDPAESDLDRRREEDYRMFTSMSVVKAFKINWCNIPPICKRVRR